MNLNMKVIQYLKTNGIEKLQEEYSVKTVTHQDGRIILNYDHIKSPHNSITNECRGLVLDSNFDLVARSFSRFFNIGEYPKEEGSFIWDNSICSQKYDGSLILYYYYKDNWHINTRGSFGNGIVGHSQLTWRDLFNSADKYGYTFNPEYTYIFELCSPYNQVVTYYDKPQLFLLSIFKGKDELCHDLIKNSPFPHETFSFENLNSIKDYLDKQPGSFEGFVLRDKYNKRLKIKNKKYIELHLLNNNGNIISPKNIIPFILAGEESEVIAYFPWTEPYITQYKNKLQQYLNELDELWEYNYLPQKDFALKIKDHPLSAILFMSRRNNSDWRHNLSVYSDLLIKALSLLTF